MAISFVFDEGNGGSGWKKSRTPATAGGRGCPVKTQTEFGKMRVRLAFRPGAFEMRV